MRGASALDRWLDGHPDVAGFVVWEPVLAEDTAAPSASRRARHARNYWDAALARSTAMQASGADPSCLAQGDAEAGVVWDALFDYPPGAARPASCGRTILQTLPRLR